jgi:flagellar assembly protein FliH
MSSERPVVQEADLHSEPFLYIATNGESSGGGDGNGGPVAWNMQGAAPKVDYEQREKEAHDRGLKEGESRARAACEAELSATRASIAAAIEKFRAEREAYFSRIEPEVVQLALAIARKILHREAQMEPLLLEGMVHVALEKIDAGTRVRLWAHPADIHFWNEHFSQPGGLKPAPELIGDPALKRGECALETEVGSTQISLDTQLKEIEQGFFDLLEQRPRVR